MHERIKERLSQAQTSAVSGHANKTSDLRPETWQYPLWVKFIHRDPHWYCRRTKEAIYIRLHSNNINRDSGIEIPEAWSLQSDSTWQPISTAADRWTDQFLPLTMPTMLWIETHQPWARFVIHQSLTPRWYKYFDSVNRYYRLTKTCSVRSKRHHQSKWQSWDKR